MPIKSSHTKKYMATVKRMSYKYMSWLRGSSTTWESKIQRILSYVIDQPMSTDDILIIMWSFPTNTTPYSGKVTDLCYHIYGRNDSKSI